MTKVWITVVAVLLALLALVGWRLDTLTSEKAALTEQNKTLTEAAERAVEREKLERKVLVARQAKIASKQRELEQAREALQNALQRNKTWSDTDVPDDVQKALGGPSDSPVTGL